MASKRDIIYLISEAGTGQFITTTKNKRLHGAKLELRRYDKVARKHVLFKEGRVKGMK